MLKFFVIMRIIYLFIFCSLVLVSGCNGAQKPVSSVMVPQPYEPQLEPQLEQPFEPPIVVDHLVPQKPKKVFEFVQIEGESYAVPYPWRGKKIAQKSPNQEALQQIPLEFTKDQSKLFLRKEACDAFVVMALAARQDDINLTAHSAFRSIWYQRKIFINLMAEGRTWEDLVRYVAPPGYSQHMLGIAVDLYPSNWYFASTPEYEWLKAHAAEFNFMESYPKNNQDGFPWEAWHWRYVKPQEKDQDIPTFEEDQPSSPHTIADYKESDKQQ